MKMAAFSSPHHHHHHHHPPPPPPYLVPDLGYVPNTSEEMSCLLEQEMIKNPTSSCISPIHPTNYLQETPLMHAIPRQENSITPNGSLECSNVSSIKFPDNSFTEPYSSSMVAHELKPIAEQATQVETQLGKKRKTMGCKVNRGGEWCDQEGILSKSTGEDEKKVKLGERKEKKIKVVHAQEEAPINSTGYVHVRARRGQATDSHSLAERVRREKISERMRLLQSLVPGCDKITGKALILDEIINYVQSLQNQVEFLVMKLASLYPTFNNLDAKTPTSEEYFNLESPLPSVPQIDSMELMTPFSGMAPISTCLLHQPDPRSIFLPQDDGDLQGDIDDQARKLANPYGHINFCSF